VVSLGIFSVVPSDKTIGRQPPTLVVLKVEKIRGLNLPGNPRATQEVILRVIALRTSNLTFIISLLCLEGWDPFNFSSFFVMRN